jgi:NAD(P)-dependent dehydrogenase (short-subunit alcohol dehydrogenase family)
MSTLEGRVAVVTGTSSGLGAQFAKALDAAGARVVLASRRNETDLALTEVLHDALAVRCDVRDPEDRPRWWPPPSNDTVGSTSSSTTPASPFPVRPKRRT